MIVIQHVRNDEEQGSGYEGLNHLLSLLKVILRERWVQMGQNQRPERLTGLLNRYTS